MDNGSDDMQRLFMLDLIQTQGKNSFMGLFESEIEVKENPKNEVIRSLSYNEILSYYRPRMNLKTIQKNIQRLDMSEELQRIETRYVI